MSKTTQHPIQPLQDRILVRPTQKPTKTPGGIVLPEIAQDKPTQGTVLAVGPDNKHVTKGDVVLFSAYAGMQLDFDGQPLLILKPDDVAATVVEA
jgi:chaperonin GroES